MSEGNAAEESSTAEQPGQDIAVTNMCIDYTR